MSSTDIPPGRQWYEKLAEQLADCDVGLVCLSPENSTNLWLMFEAGALAKSTRMGSIITIRTNLDLDLPAPLSMYQAVHIDREGLRSLMKTLAADDNESKLEPTEFETLFNHLWPAIEADLQTKLNALGPNQQIVQSAKSKSDRELLEELLILARSSHQPTKKDLLEVIRAWERRLREIAESAYEAAEKYDAPTSSVSFRFEEAADDLSKAVELLSKTTIHEP